MEPLRGATALKYVAFAASSSTKSINKQLVSYAASLLTNAETEILDLNDYELPLFSQDREQELGHPALAKDFLAKIEAADGVLISFAEHNGSYTAAYKNLFDWLSRIQKKVYDTKKVLVLSTSPGPGGAKNVMAAALDSLPHFGATITGHFSLPSFGENFDKDNQVISNEALRKALQLEIEKLHQQA